jgi:ribosome maturation factor RimP
LRERKTEGANSPSSFAKNRMITVDKIKNIADLKIAEGTNFIVEISVKPGNKITVLLDNDEGVSISDCVAMSRHIEFSLDRESEDFELNVMSPGLTEPFKTLRQYQKYIEKQIDVVTKENKKISGKLLSVNNEGIELETKIKPARPSDGSRSGGEKTEGKKAKQLIINKIDLTFSQIKQTKVVISF